MPDIVSIQSMGVILFIVTSLFGDISQTIWWVLIGNIWKLASGVKLIVEMLTNYRAKVDKLSSAKISQNPRRMSTSWKFIISQIGLSLGQGHVEGWAIREIPLGNSRLCLGEKESQKKKKKERKKKRKRKRRTWWEAKSRTFEGGERIKDLKRKDPDRGAREPPERPWEAWASSRSPAAPEALISSAFESLHQTLREPGRLSPAYGWPQLGTDRWSNQPSTT